MMACSCSIPQRLWYGIQTAHAIQVRLVGDVLVQCAAGLLLAQEKRQVIGPKRNGGLRKVENIAGFQALGTRLAH